MKGLATTSSTFATVKISGRSARKHYGLQSHKKFNAQVHDMSLRSVQACLDLQYSSNQFYRVWSSFEMEHRIGTMDWFIQKVYQWALQHGRSNIFPGQ